MKVAEVKVEMKTWNIEVYTNKQGHKFIKAMYDYLWYAT